MYKFNKSEVLENGTIQLRQIEVLELADGTTREGGYHRVAYTPDMDIASIECDRCKALATALWTPEVVEAYVSSLEESQVEEL